MARVRRDYNRISGVRDPSLIVIATEGEKTERQYFEGIKSKCQLSSSRIKIRVLENRSTGHSSPSHVLDQLDDYKREFGLGSNDELCMLIDRDKQSWGDSEISAVAAACSKKQYLLALSNPCFEIWLLLHHENIESCDENKRKLILKNKNSFLKKELRRILGEFNPSNLKIDDFWDKTSVAIERAKTLDTTPQFRWPNTIGSRVYLLMTKIISSIEA